MGLVCLATHLVLDELVILKFVRPDLAGNEEAVERLLVEARLAAQLRGNHFARIYDAGRLEDGVPYLAMEHLVGHTLADELEARGGTLPEAEAVEWIIQACTALEECHEIGIVHRDVKPENLFLAEPARGDRVLKLIDFGISKHIHLNRGQRRLTNPGESLGSPWYMAPEQMRTPHLVDRRADIWSLGVVLFELVGGRMPFDGNTLAEVCAQVLCAEPAPLSAAANAVGPGLSGVVARCLNKDPQQRYATAGALAGALRNWATGDAPAIGSALENPDASLLPMAPELGSAAPVPVLPLDPEVELGVPDESEASDYARGALRIPGERRWGPAFAGLGMIAATVASVLLVVPEVRAKVARVSSHYTQGWLTPAQLGVSIPDSEISPSLRPVRPALALISVPPSEFEFNETGSTTVQPAESRPAMTKPFVKPAHSGGADAVAAEPKLSLAEIAARRAGYQQYLRDNGLVTVKEALEDLGSSKVSGDNPY
ncbi:MAG: serine/threonine protein kinase [Myxococcales bacterium]|nr:serine/threonine protein kinase [Myxococcales bacterium]